MKNDSSISAGRIFHPSQHVYSAEDHGSSVNPIASEGFAHAMVRSLGAPPVGQDDRADLAPIIRNPENTETAVPSTVA